MADVTNVMLPVRARRDDPEDATGARAEGSSKVAGGERASAGFEAIFNEQSVTSDPVIDTLLSPRAGNR